MMRFKSPTSILIDTYIFTKSAGGMAKSTAYLYDAVFRLFQQDISMHGFSAKPLKSDVVLPFPNTAWPIPLGRETWRLTMFPLYTHCFPYDVIHFPANGLIPTGLPKSSRVAMTLHDLLQLDVDDFYTPERLQKKEAYVQRLRQDLDRSQVLFTVSDYSAERIQFHFPHLQNAPIVIPNAPTLQRPSHMQAMTLDALNAPYFLYTGRYEKRKGLEWLLDAFLEGHELGQLQSHLYLTGESAFISEHFTIQLEKAKALGIVKELGYVSDEAMTTLMNEAVALVYPSSAEGFGLPPLEAMTMYCPVITTRATALPYTCGKAAYYVEANDPSSLLVAMQRLEKEPHLRAELIALGLTQVEKFSWTRSAERFVEALSL
jgi:glycosyltransferase involved in cell wall biosynthesis